MGKGPLLQRGEGVRQDRDSRGGLRPVEATGAQRVLAQAVLGTVPAVVRDAPPPLYTRIDLVEGVDGLPVVLEVELAEPSLFLPQAGDALPRLVRAVDALL